MEWNQYWRQEPWGAMRDNIHAGLIASTIANANRKKNAKPFSYQDFLIIDREEQAARQTAQTMAWLKALAKRKNGN